MKNRVHSFLLVVGIFLIAGIVRGQQPILPIILKNIYHHNKPLQQKKINLLPIMVELGSVVFYFTQKPEIKLVAQELDSVTGFKKVTFFLPNVMVEGYEGNSMIQLLQEQKNPFYAVFLKQVNKPEEGMLCVVMYKDSQVLFSHESFIAIKGQPSLGLHFYNKSVLYSLSREKSVVRTACVSRPPAVVIDCGHGGNDPGAEFYGIKEKDITLTIGKYVADYLRTKGIKTHLTRAQDTTASLENRTLRVFQASGRGATLLISLHANAAENKKAMGLELFCLNPDFLLKRLPGDNVQLSKTIKIYYSELYSRSIDLAKSLQENLLEIVKIDNPLALSRKIKIKDGVAQILLGSVLPAIIVELGFLSNQIEARLLAKTAYQIRLAHALGKGIVSFLRQQGYNIA